MSAARSVALVLACCALSALLSAKPAFAQPMTDLVAQPKYVSTERFVLELRVGPYQPSMGGNDAFNRFFHGDIGPMFAVELDVIGYRVPDVLYLGGAGRIGTASFSGKTLNEQGSSTSEETSLSVLPLDLLAVLRVDVLARRLSVPFILTGKLGYEWAHWSTDSSGADKHKGFSIGIGWGAQVALDLDSLDGAAARNLDEEWGINHSFVFFELFEFIPSNRSLPIGDRTWSAGLGFVF
jgi:hypothetical protein